MNIIKNNPYRIIGILVGTSTREEHSKTKKLKMYIGAQQEVPEDFSFPIIGLLNRNIENVEDAISKLNLNNDRVNASIFWFYNGNAITDEPMFDTLKASKEEAKEAIDVWIKLAAADEVTKRNASAFQNLSTLYLNSALNNEIISKNKLEKGISLKLKFLESDFSNDFIKLSSDETYKVSKEALQIYFLTQVYNEIEKVDAALVEWYLECISKINFTAKQNYLNDFVSKPIEVLKNLIEENKIVRKESPSKAYVLGNSLYTTGSEKIIIIQNILGKSNIQFTSISDKLSDEILQCGIVYFKKYRDTDTDPSAKAMDLFKKAKKLAVGSIAIQRCQENTENLQEWIDDSSERELNKKIGEDVKFIMDLLNLAVTTLKNKGSYPKGYNDPYSDLPFSAQPHNKEFSKEDVKAQLSKPDFDFGRLKDKEFRINIFRLARDIPKKCKPKLENIKNHIGISNEIYQKISNRVVSISLSCIIDYVNSSANEMFNTPPSVGDIEINVMDSIGQLDMNNETRKRYLEQKQALMNIKSATVRRNSKSSGGGCYIATMVYGDYEHPQVKILREFRDNVLAKYILGKYFIKTYYKYSPKLVERLKGKENINVIIRKTLNQIIKIIKK